MQTLSPPSPRRRILEAICLVLGGLLLVLLLLLTFNHFLVQPTFRDLEHRQALEDNDRASAALDHELANLVDLARDWAYWDEAYAFVSKPNLSFIEANCPAGTVLAENSGIDILAFFNQEGDLLVMRAFHPGQGHPVSLALLGGDRPPILTLLAPTFQNAAPLRGPIETEHGLLLLAAKPILTSEMKGPARGVLLMGRFVDEAKIAALAGRTKVAISIATRRSLTDAGDQALFDRMAAAGTEHHVQVESGMVHRLRLDIENKPLALLRTPVRGEISRIGTHTGSLLTSVLGSIALALLICLAMYRWRMANAHHALSESEDRYRQLFEAESDAIFLMAKETGQILEANQAAATLYGYHRNELLRLKNTDLSAEPEATRQVVREADCEADQVVSVPLRWHRRKDGTVFPVEITGRFFLHKGQQVHIAAVRDISERKRIEDRLQFTQFAVDCFGDGAFWVNSEGRLEYVNREGCRSLGYTREELVGKTIADIDPLFPFAEWPAYWRKLQEEKHALIESAHKTKDGRVFPVEIQANYIAFGDREFNCAIVRDISERKRLEKERAELEAINWQLHKEESLGRMAGAIAHHFNNQLMAIMGRIELAHQYLHTFDTEAAIRQLDLAQASARKAASISGSMLTYLGQSANAGQSFRHLAEACRQSLPVLQTIVPADVVLDTELEDPGPTVVVNVDQIRQILTNLVTNSVESLAGHSGRIRLEVRTVAAADLPAGTLFPPGWRPRDPAYGCLSVFDSGCGIAPDSMEKLFDPFYSTKFTGRGLGLPVALGLTKAHGGAVVVHSEPGAGSVFSILLPLAAGEDSEAGRAIDPKENRNA